MSSIRNFVGRLPSDLLTRFLERHDVRLDANAYSLSPKKIADAIDEALRQRGPGARARMMSEIEMIDRLTTEIGQLASVFVGLAITVLWTALHSARTVLGRLDAHAASPPSRRRLLIVTIVATAGSLTLLLALWLF